MSEREKELEALLSECRVAFGIINMLHHDTQAALMREKITAVLSKPNSEAA